MDIIKKFIEINQKVCLVIEGKLPQAKKDITEEYSTVVSKYANQKHTPTIVDIGGGRLTPYFKYLKPNLKHELIVIDEDKKELEKNLNANKVIIANLNNTLPLKNNSVDIITSRYVFEHLNDIPNFLLNSNKSLKNGGLSINLFSCKFAIFALLNQIIPQQLSKLLLNNLVLNSKHIRGFKTNYNYCYYSSIINVFIKTGFKVERISLSYYQSRYFSFFVPFYIISIFYELIMFSLGLKNLCAYILIVARKNGD
ncbi:MAG: methyltransferase domain-containing protein [Candidatus Daviesbacteria bacterium]|nr:methyltransferase domain-containing protein [Candidatus Daviesbacteria bacterium]